MQIPSNKIAIAVLAIGLFLSALWLSEASARPVLNDNEIEFGGGFFHARGSDTGALNLDASYGYYLSPDWQVGFRQGLNINFIDDARDVWTATSAPFLNVHFPLSDNVVPFFGGFLGLVWNDRDVTGTLGPNTGIKFFLNDQTYFTTKYRYEWFFDSVRSAAPNRSQANHIVNFGIGFVWGGKRG